MLTLKKDDFKNIFSRSIAEEKQKLDFFLQLFDDWEKLQIAKFAYIFKERKFNIHSILYKEGDPARFVFIIKKGEILLFKRDSKYNYTTKIAPGEEDTPIKKNMIWKANKESV